MIRVEMHDGTYIRVAPRGLDLLIRHGRVKRFRRHSGWAVVGRDATRTIPPSGTYNGPERRSNH
jgi:hypothetical protein